MNYLIILTMHELLTNSVTLFFVIRKIIGQLKEHNNYM